MSADGTSGRWDKGVDMTENENQTPEEDDVAGHARGPSQAVFPPNANDDDDVEGHKSPLTMQAPGMQAPGVYPPNADA